MSFVPLLRKLTVDIKQTIVNPVDFKKMGDILKTLKNERIGIIKELNKQLDKNIHTLHFNNFGYSKNIIYTNDILTAFLVVWKPFSSTDRHGHPQNGCFVLKLDGKWREDLYRQDGFIDSRRILEGDISYIDNSIGEHKMTYLGDKPGLSINIYSPTCEIPDIK